ncbi:hypothetical protein TNCV_1546541 [Trichonephila clavipes]|nr:hypothetical protein TNCV_1546541 [Trichonephila clavipes]
MTFERKILREFFGAVSQNGIFWKYDTTVELQSKYREPNIVKWIKDSKIRRLGHVFRYSNENPVKKITFQTPEEKRKRGRPRTQNGWIKGKKRLKDLGINRWRNIASKRSRWCKLIETGLANNWLEHSKRRIDV